MKPLLTQEMAEQAFEIVKPSLSSLMAIAVKRDNEFPHHRHFHIGVVNPSLHWVEGAAIEDAVLFEKSISEDSVAWEYEYDKIARSKGLISWREGMPSGQVMHMAPSRLRKGDAVYPGSWITESGLIIFASGLNGYDDEACSKFFGAACDALLANAYAEIQASGRDFV